MSLTVEDGSGLSTADSFVSVADCDAYHVARNNTTWTGTTTAKEGAIIRATDYLCGSYLWRGFTVSSTQSLCWPRMASEPPYPSTLAGGGTIARLVDANGWEVDTDSVPQVVVNACCELALEALSASLDSAQDRGGRVKRKRVEGVVEIEYQDGAPPNKTYTSVDKMLKRSGLIKNSNSIRMYRV